MGFRKVFLAAILSLISAMAGAADLRVMSSNAMREALRELVPQFEKTSGHKVALTFLGSADIMKRLRAGESGVDVVILQASSVDELAAEGIVVRASRVDFAKSMIGVAVRPGAPTPDISSGEALKRALLASNSIVISSGPSGIYLSGLFERIGIPRDKIVQSKSGTQSGEVLARGEAEIGFQQVSELIAIEGINYLGPLPPDIQHVTVFSGGIHVAAADPQAARALMGFLASPTAAPVLRAKGMEPAP